MFIVLESSPVSRWAQKRFCPARSELQPLVQVQGIGSAGDELPRSIQHSGLSEVSDMYIYI